MAVIYVASGQSRQIDRSKNEVSAHEITVETDTEHSIYSSFSLQQLNMVSLDQQHPVDFLAMLNGSVLGDWRTVVLREVSR